MVPLSTPFISYDQDRSPSRIMPRQGLNNSLAATTPLTGRLSQGVVAGRTPPAPLPMVQIALAVVIAVLFVSALALKPATMAGFPTLGNLSTDACSDLLDDGPKPPDMPILSPSVEQAQLIFPGPTAVALDRQPVFRPRLVSFPALPQGPPART